MYRRLSVCVYTVHQLNPGSFLCQADALLPHQKVSAAEPYTSEEEGKEGKGGHIEGDNITLSLSLLVTLLASGFFVLGI